MTSHSRRPVDALAVRRPSTPLEVALSVTAMLDDAEAEIARLRAHLATLASDGLPGDARSAARSARIVEGVTGQAADQLRDLAARQSLVE